MWASYGMERQRKGSVGGLSLYDKLIKITRKANKQIQIFIRNLFT